MSNEQSAPKQAKFIEISVFLNSGREIKGYVPFDKTALNSFFVDDADTMLLVLHKRPDTNSPVLNFRVKTDAVEFVCSKEWTNEDS